MIEKELPDFESQAALFLKITPTRCRNSQLNEFCLEIICSCSSENFDSPYYRGCTMDAYQNLISGDKSLLGYMVIALVGLIVL